MPEYNIPELMNRFFGLGGLRIYFPDTGPQKPVNLPGFENVKVMEVPSSEIRSILGTPIYEQVTFKTPDGDYAIPDWPLIEIRQAKLVIKTAMQGRNGTVKEFISMDDHRVIIRGLLINHNEQAMPLKQVKDLYELFKINREMTVENELLNLLGIHALVLEDIAFPAVEGFIQVQPFTLKCVSDEPLELTITRNL